LAPTSVSANTITYGPYEDTSAFSYSDLSVHFENGKPFITATSVVKEIEVSHWGANVAIEETYNIQHDGAALKGTFSRFDYQRTPPGKGSVVAALKQTLPAGASDVYYRDEIGNISTSHLFEVESGPVMDVIPRFPLFGGWKIGFYFGYNLPSSNYLFTDASDSSLYVLDVSFASAFPEVSIDELTVRIILPEGAKYGFISIYPLIVR
jgi:oligosaccharyltransferase complex subunit alpha (ribophorin I)